MSSRTTDNLGGDEPKLSLMRMVDGLRHIAREHDRLATALRSGQSMPAIEDNAKAEDERAAWLHKSADFLLQIATLMPAMPNKESNGSSLKPLSGQP